LRHDGLKPTGEPFQLATVFRLEVNVSIHLLFSWRALMARRYSRSASKDVERAMRKRKRGTLRSSSGRKVKSRKQAIAIGLSEARRKGKKVPKRKRGRK
jgi:hypothetical protein